MGHMKVAVEFILALGALFFFGLMMGDLFLMGLQKIKIQAAAQGAVRVLGKSRLETEGEMENWAKAFLAKKGVPLLSVTVRLEELKLKEGMPKERRRKRVRVIHLDAVQSYTPYFTALHQLMNHAVFHWRTHERALQIL